MSVKEQFGRTVDAVDQVLNNGGPDPHAVRFSIKQLVSAYQAQEVVRDAYLSYSDSGVVQWKTFLRAANVRKGEQLDEYVDRIRQSLDEMRSFDAKVLKPN